MKWFKHILSCIALIGILFTCYVGLTIEAPEILQGSLLFLYSMCSGCTLLTYRISLIDRTSLKWTTLALTILILTGLTAMYIDKTLFYEYGNITLAGFILLIGDATLQLLQKNKNGVLYTTARLSLFLLITVLIGILIIEPEATVVFDIAQLLVIAISLMTLIHFFLLGNTDQSK